MVSGEARGLLLVHLMVSAAGGAEVTLISYQEPVRTKYFTIFLPFFFLNKTKRLDPYPNCVGSFGDSAECVPLITLKKKIRVVRIIGTQDFYKCM